MVFFSRMNLPDDFPLKSDANSLATRETRWLKLLDVLVYIGVYFYFHWLVWLLKRNYRILMNSNVGLVGFVISLLQLYFLVPKLKINIRQIKPMLALPWNGSCGW